MDFSRFTGLSSCIAGGVYFICHRYPHHSAGCAEKNSACWRVRKKGRFAGLLQNPEAADADGSGEIGILESMVLGVAISANALTNGLSAGLIGLSPAAISITAAIGSFLTIWIGCSLGKKAASLRIGSFHVGQFSTVLSGVIILIIAANTLLF